MSTVLYCAVVRSMEEGAPRIAVGDLLAEVALVFARCAPKGEECSHCRRRRPHRQLLFAL